MKSKRFSKLIAGALSVVMTLCCVFVPAFAADHPGAVNGNTGMEPVKKVTVIDTHSFFKVDADGVTVIYADKDTDGFEAVPSRYIKGSSYNEGDISFGMYVAANKVHFVDLSLCSDNGDGTYSFFHGTEDSATVSKDVDTVDNNKSTIETQFSINIENGIDPDGTEKEEVVKSNADEFVDYEITVATKTSYQLKATVPMYVCMYGYRGTGNVITPSKDAYRIKNYSTITGAAEARIVDIAKVTHMTKLFDEDHSDEEIFAIAYDAAAKTYTYWYSDPQGEAGWVAPENFKVIKDDHINASGECYVIFIDGEYIFRAASVLDGADLRETVNKIDANHPLAADFAFNGFKFGTEFSVGDMGTAEGDITSEGLAIKVTDLQAKPATWRMVGMNTPVSALKRGELAMNIAPEKAQYNASAIDMADISAKTDITDRGWFLAAPAIEADGSVKEENATVLGLITKAQMAGGNVNSDGCTPVVKVCYTIAPVFAEGDIQTGTAVAGGIDTNRR